MADLEPSSITSGETWGSPTISGTIYPGSITSGESWGTATVIPEFAPTASGDPTPFRIYIDGTLRNDYILAGPRKPISISSRTDSRSTCKLTWFDETGALRPSEDDEVIVVDSAESGTPRIFGGLITKINEIAYPRTTAIELSLTCQDWGIITEQRDIGKVLPGAQGGVSSITFAHIITNYLDGSGITYGSVSGGLGKDLGDQTFYYIKVKEAFDRVARSDGLNWRIDYYKQFHAFDAATGYQAAPFNLADNDGNALEGLSVETNPSLRANRVVVKNTLAFAAVWTETYSGVQFGTPEQYPTDYFLTVKPIVSVNGTPELVVELGDIQTTPNWKWYYINNGTGIFHNPNLADSDPGDTITIEYPSPLPWVAISEDAVDIAASRELTAIIDAKDLQGKSEMQALADAMLARLKVSPTAIKFPTRRSGLQPGQKITVNLTKPPVTETLIIESVDGREVGKSHFIWNVSASNTALHRTGSGARYFGELIERGRLPIPKKGFKVTVKLAHTTEGLTNPGLVTGVIDDIYTAERGGVFTEWRMRFKSVDDGTDTTADIVMDVYVNGASIFDVGQRPTFEAGSSGTVTGWEFTSDPQELSARDVITAEVISADPLAKDGILELIANT
jgi:hypothetical protein